MQPVAARSPEPICENAAVNLACWRARHRSFGMVQAASLDRGQLPLRHSSYI